MGSLPLIRSALLACALALVFQGRAHAFADLFRFNDAAAQGGGGGRWFTGSPAEGYSCDVCHDGPRSAQVVVQGVPEIYQPGATYEMYVSWPATSLHVTAMVELTDQLGRGAGTSVVPEMAINPAETCQPIEQGVPAAVLLAGTGLGLADERQLVGMQDCGGNQLHWSWTAPATDIGPVVFSGGLVEPDQQKNAEGDRGVRLFRTIGSASQAAPEMQLSGSCAIGRRSRGAGPSMLAIAWLLLLRSRRRF
ncbi:MAG TPA: hypothetical protein VJV78_13495 [Polyangiales bacterium]|nr:hypothetical protein [Polyangiales bacterium]